MGTDKLLCGIWNAEEFNSTLLLWSYIVFALCGLVLFIAGLVFTAAVGAVGQTAVYLLALGLFFVIVGCIALLGVRFQNPLLLFIVELVNIALYFAMFIVVMVSVMIASGAKDPIQRLYDEHWDDLKLEIFGGTGSLYENGCTSSHFGSNHACLDFFGTFKSSGNCAPVKDRADLDVPGLYGLNCSRLGDLPGVDCPALQAECAQCDVQCKAMYVKHSKDKNVPACIITLLVCAYLVVVVVMHGVLRLLDDPGDRVKVTPRCCKGVPLLSWLAIVIDLGFSSLGLSLIVAAFLTVNTNSGTDAGTLWIFLLAFGLALLFIPCFQIGMMASHRNPMYALDCVLIALFFILSLLAIFLGFLSGALVEDMNSMYDQNYAKYRGELELIDHTYCSLSFDDCKTVTTTAACQPLAPTASCILPLPAEERASAPAEMHYIDKRALWSNQHAAMQYIPYKNLPSNHMMHVCKSSNLCIRCLPAIELLKTHGFYFNRSTISATGRTPLNDTRDASADVVLAWTGELHKAVMEAGGYSSAASRSLAKCENALLSMSGASMEELWDDFPNPARPCEVLDSVTVGGLGRGFMLRLPTDQGYKVSTNLMGMRDSLGNVTGAYKPVITAKEYSQTYRCAKYLLAMTEQTGASDAECQPDTACRTMVTARFDDVYHYMNASNAPFCQYPDESCKEKVAFEVEKQFFVIGIIGVCVIVFQLFVIFTTYWGVLAYLPASWKRDDVFENPELDAEAEDESWKMHDPSSKFSEDVDVSHNKYNAI